ncbi:MAG TPA: zf-HC2 domain-containing protein [Terracidiphilus sp.]|nr:zf-HC2 domain-containing protein [Terracidiphilus sp.]
MNANSILDVHPDAESLNAFAEQALAERERGLILAHLAGCSRCRQVVYLAQEVAAEMEPAVAAPTVRLENRRDSWFRSWWFAWAPVAALAVVVALAYVMHSRRVETVSEMAKVMPQTAPQNGGGNSGSPTQPTGVPATPVSAGPAPSEARERKKTPTSERSAQLTPSLSAAMATAPGANEPAVAALQKEQERASAASQSYVMAAKTMAQASGNESAKREEVDRIVTAAAPQFDASPAPPASFEAGARPRAGGVFAVYKGNDAELPSGLAVVSTASSQHRTLVVDKAGSVFLSEGSGGHWENVVRQWSGRAVKVRTQAAVQSSPFDATPSPDTVFEIVNDQGKVWVSTDGRTWKAK